MRLGKHLKAVADAKHGSPALREAFEGTHNFREAGDGAGPKVVAVGEAAGEDHGVHALEVGVRVPELDGFGARAFDGVERVAVAVGAREDGDAYPHVASLQRVVFFSTPDSRYFKKRSPTRTPRWSGS